MSRSKKQTRNSDAKTTSRITKSRFLGKLKKAVITGMIFAAASFGGRMLLSNGALAKGNEVKKPAVKVVKNEKPVLLAQLDPKKTKEPSKAKEEPVLLAQLDNKNTPKPMNASEVKENLRIVPDGLEQYTGVPVRIWVTGDDDKKRVNVPVSSYDDKGNRISTLYTNEAGYIDFTFADAGKYRFGLNDNGKTILPLYVKKMAAGSLKEMRKLAKETTKENGYIEAMSTATSTDKRLSFVIATIVSHSTMFAVDVNLTNLKRELLKNPELTIVLDENASVFLVNEPLPYKKTFRTSLAPLKKMYEKINGTEMKYVRLILDKGTGKEGPWTSITVVPVDKPNGTIETGPSLNVVVFKNNRKKIYGGHLMIN